MIIKFPDFSVEGDRLKTSKGTVHPASPELQALAAIYQTLNEINTKLDAPIVNVTNYPPTPPSKK